MICFLLRVMQFGFGGSGGLCMCLSGLTAGCCAARGLAKCCAGCCRCRLRNCSCIKWFMRRTGADTFDDFEMMILIHEVQLVCRGKKPSISVRVIAGDHQVQTEESRDVFQQPLAVYVEQGTSFVKLECVNSRKHVIASLKLDILKDILDPNCKHLPGELYSMKQKHKDIQNPKIKLTINKDYQEELEKGAMLVQGMGVSKETGVVLRHQLDNLPDEGGDNFGPSNSIQEGGLAPEVDLLMKGCSGPLTMFGSWGSTKKVYVAVQYKVEDRKLRFGVFKDKEDCDRSCKPLQEIDLMKIFSVHPDPSRKEVFVIEYAPAEKERKRLLMQRLDRSRDAWVEMLQLLIKTVRQQREDKRKNKAQCDKQKTIALAGSGGLDEDPPYAQRRNVSPRPANPYMSQLPQGGLSFSQSASSRYQS